MKASIFLKAARYPNGGRIAVITVVIMVLTLRKDASFKRIFSLSHGANVNGLYFFPFFLR